MRVRAAVAAALLALAACGEELPTEAGSGLLPDNLVRTAEIVLDPERFAIWDTAFGGFGSTADVGYLVLADAWDGALDSNILARFGGLPSQIVALDTLGATRTDTVPRLLGGALVLGVDTLLSSAPGPVTLQVFRTLEEWDERTATWSLRINTLEEQEPWSTPGGTRSDVIGEGVWEPGEDSILLEIDSATVRTWGDLEDPTRGALVVAAAAGARLQIISANLRVDFRPSFNPDTTVVFHLPAIDATFIYQPELVPVSSVARVGGVPSWRTIVRLRERFDTISVPCPGVPNCVMPLSEVTVTRASLLLEQVPSPPGFVLEDSLRIVLRTALASDQLPLVRTPLGEIVGVVPEAVPAGSSAGVHAFPITPLIAALARAPDEEGTRPPPFVALVPLREGTTVGFVTFAGLPRLRLTYTIAGNWGLQ